MSPKRVSQLMITLVVISLIGIMSILFTRYNALADCDYTDKRICDFIKNFDQNPGLAASGTYMETGEFGVYNGTWKTDQESVQFTMYRGETEVMNIISDNSYMYLKDYQDGKWWQQKRSDSMLYETQLPFDPKAFFSKIKQDLDDVQTEFMFIQTISCDKKQCHRFQLKNPKISGQKFIYITTDTSKLNRVLTTKENNVVEIGIDAYEKPTIERPTDVKEPKLKQNLFLEWIQQLNERNITYEYVEEFEEERQRSEGPTPIPTATVISPSP